MLGWLSPSGHATRVSSAPSLPSHKAFCPPRCRLPLTRQTQHCLVESQLIFWAVSGGDDNDGSSGNPTMLKCHQVMCGKARAGQRGLLPQGRKETQVCERLGYCHSPATIITATWDSLCIKAVRALLSVNSKQTAVTFNNSPQCPQVLMCILWAGTEGSRRGTGNTGDRQCYPQPPSI